MDHSVRFFIAGAFTAATAFDKVSRSIKRFRIDRKRPRVPGRRLVPGSICDTSEEPIASQGAEPKGEAYWEWNLRIDGIK